MQKSGVGWADLRPKCLVLAFLIFFCESFLAKISPRGFFFDHFENFFFFGPNFKTSRTDFLGCVSSSFQNAVTVVQTAVAIVQNLASRLGIKISSFCIRKKLRGLIKQISPRGFFRNGA